MMGEMCLEDNDSRDLEVVVQSDVLYEVLSRVDGVTLAIAACAGPAFHAVSRNETVWESACNRRWPSTRNPDVKFLISFLGGFQKFYSQCFPLVVFKQPFVFDASDTVLKDAEDWFDDEQDMVEELSDTSPMDFVSLVDVFCRGKHVDSKVLHGIPGADDLHGWFSSCPFRIDLFNYNDKDGREDDAVVSVDADDGHDHDYMNFASSSSSVIRICELGLPEITSIDKERKDGTFWKAFWDGIEVSWILINKKTKQFANLASWRPLSGMRHWPNDTDFLVKFGSILPAHQLLAPKLIQCNVVLKCRLLGGPNSTNMEGKFTQLVITELSLQLEDIAGTRLNGRHSLLALKEALSCRKSTNHGVVHESYRQYMTALSQLKGKQLKNEGWVDSVCIMYVFLIFVLFWYLMV